MANSFINKKVDLTTTDLTTLYTVPSFKSSVVKSLLVSEDAGSGSTITITLVNSSGTIFNLFKTKTISGNATTELLTNPLIMEESEILKVQAADANQLHVIASILEIQPREVTT
jgi:expansin (peptidoglycan-binding protein)